MTNAGSSLNSTLSSMREILSDRSTGRNASPRGVANLERVTGQPEANCRYQASLQLAYRLLSPEPFWLVCTPPKFTRVYGADIVMESVPLTENCPTPVRVEKCYGDVKPVAAPPPRRLRHIMVRSVKNYGLRQGYPQRIGCNMRCGVC